MLVFNTPLSATIVVPEKVLNSVDMLQFNGTPPLNLVVKQNKNLDVLINPAYLVVDGIKATQLTVAAGLPPKMKPKTSATLIVLGQQASKINQYYK
jgi:hypothetical protein